MKWIGQHIYDKISRFRNEVYLESISASTETDMLVVDSAGKVTKRAIDAITVDVSDFLTDGADNRVVTATGTDALLAETYLTFQNTGNVSTLSVLSDQDTGDLFSIATTTHGATTLTTTDDDATAAHFEIATDGNITLDSAALTNIESVGLTKFTSAGVRIENASTSGAVALTVRNKDTDKVALFVHTDNIDADAMEVSAKVVTTASAILVDCDSLTTGSAIHLDVDDSLTTSATKSLMHIDYNKSGDTASGQSSLVTGLEISMNDLADDNLGLTLLQGLKITCDSTDADGIANQNGVQVVLTGSDTGSAAVGYMSQVENGGVDFIAQSSVDTRDNFKIATGAAGATTLTTTDYTVGATAHFEVAADGDITLDAAGDIALEGDTTVTGNLTVSGNVTAKQYRIINASFRDDIGTAKHYLPLKTEREDEVLTRAEGSELSVMDGRVVSVSLRVENLNTGAGSQDNEITFGIETNVVGAGYDNWTVIETETLTVENTDDQHLFHYVFDVDTYPKHWDSTDMWAVSIQSDTAMSAANEKFFVTIVVEDDWSTYLGGVSREIDTTPS